MSKSFHSIACPHCEQKAIVRTSRKVTRVVREIYFACTEPRCGHTFVAQLAILRTLSPSACPNPLVNLPLRPSPLGENADNDNGQPDVLPLHA